MRYTDVLYPPLLMLEALGVIGQAARRPSNGVLLSKVKTLTLRKDAVTSHRRISAIPQLKCIGGNGKGLHEVDVMRCVNQGADYDDDNVQWTCTASLPSEFKLGATDVICEGYDSPEDPYVLKGSCGVEYRLVLTDQGKEKYGRGGSNLWQNFRGHRQIDLSSVIFWGLLIAVLGWIIYSAFFAGGRGRLRRPEWNNPWGWGGGGGGGGGGRGNDDPPPPYDYQPRRKPSARPSSVSGPGQEGWRPGFWTGLLGGAAATYVAGNSARPRRRSPLARFEEDDQWGGGGSSAYGAGSVGSSSASSSRYESTGFGSTRRR